MYVSGRANNYRQRTGNVGNAEPERFTVPAEYDGNALRTPEALARAEEAFRRGYVFDENDITTVAEEKTVNADEKVSVSEEIHTEPSAAVDAVAEISDVNDESITAPSEPSVTAAAMTEPSKEGVISGLFHSIKTEHIIIIAAILILWDSRADDELLIMLAILLFC